MMQRIMVVAVLVLQLGLLGYELVAEYDTSVRQVALGLTNLAAIGGYLFAARFLLRRYGIVLHWVVLVVIAAAVWLDALGNFQHFYGSIWWWDRLTHAVGGLAVTAAIAIVIFSLWNAGRLNVSWRVANLYALALAQSLGAVYEISEWVGDLWFGTHRVGDRFDSPRDLFFNMLGGLLVLGVAAWWRMRRRATRSDAP